MSKPGNKVSSPTAEEGRKLKNVLVLHSHNASADYLDEQFLAGYGPNLSSWDDNSGGIDPRLLVKEFQSPDGIQFHHFKNKDIWNDSSNQDTIAPCIDALERYIKERNEKLDAIVVTAPYGTNYENAETIAWLSGMKERFPGVKILVHGYSARAIDVEESRNRFAIPKSPEHETEFNRKPVVITQDNPNYILAKPVDMMPVNAPYSEIPNQLRALLGMPPYQEQTKIPHR
jgi:hypothetical protein